MLVVEIMFIGRALIHGLDSTVEGLRSLLMNFCIMVHCC